MYIEVDDRDINMDNNIISYELVDRWRLNGQPTEFTAGASLSSQIYYPGIHGFGRLRMSFRVECAEYYSGEFCENLNECLSESINCNQGNCVDGDGSGTCMCNPGYTGQFCGTEINECEVLNIDCNENEQCMDELNSYTCVCNAGYTGADCETDIDDCVNVNCSGRGNCTDRVNGFDCDCFPGYTDAICQTDIDECDGINCSGNGRCVDMVSMFLCDCEPGYTGADCETNIDDCVNRNCSGNGVCVDGVNSFSCKCVSGFTGEMCSVETQGKHFLIIPTSGGEIP